MCINIGEYISWINVCTYIEKRNLMITIKRILFGVLVQYLINIMKHNNSNQSFVLIITK